MLPGALQRAEAPAESLLQQGVEGLGRFRQRDRAIGQCHAMPATQQRQREILIFRQRIGAESTGRHHRAATPRANGARHHRDAVQHDECAAVEILARHILHRLPSGDQVHPIAHLGVARHRTHPTIRERMHQVPDRVRHEERIGVDHHDDVTRGVRDPVVERGRLAAVHLPHHAQARVIAALCRRVSGVIRRTIIDHQHFERVVFLRQHRAHRAGDHPPFVVRRNKHRHHWLVVRVLHAAPIPRHEPLQRGEGPDPEHAQQSQHERHQECTDDQRFAHTGHAQRDEIQHAL